MRRLWMMRVLTVVLLGAAMLLPSQAIGEGLLSEEYAIIYPDYAERKEISAAKSLQKALSQAGIRLDLETDWVKQGETIPEDACEILVGETNRLESVNAKALLKRNDFIIEKKGNRIVILGGSPNATVQAVKYFTANCIAGKHVNVPTEAYVSRGEYRTERIMLNGADISEYVIFTKNLTVFDELEVDALIDWIADMSGDTIRAADETADAEHVIRIIRAEDDSCSIDVAADEISIVGGGENGLQLALAEFKSSILVNVHSEETRVMMETKEIHTAYRPLVEINLPEEYPAMEVEASTEGVMAAFTQARAELPEEITVIQPVYPEDYPYSLVNSIYVSPDGDDHASGTMADPLRTPEVALARVQGKKGGVIYLREGVYTVSGLRFTDECSGTDYAPLFISAYNGEAVTLTGARDIPVSCFQPVTDSEIIARLDPNAVDHILVADLKEIGVEANDVPEFSMYSRPILYINGEQGTVARYPDEGGELNQGEVVKIGKVEIKHSELYGMDMTDGWAFKLTDEHPLTWSDQDDLWFYGAVHAEWDLKHYKVSINREEKTIASDENNIYGAGWRDDNTYFLYNILEELNAPDEWYFDREQCKLYIYAQEEVQSVSLVLTSAPIIKLDHASNIVVNDIRVTGTAGVGIEIQNGYQNIVENCEVFNCGSNGVSISGRKSGVIYSVLSHNGSNQAYIADTPRVPLVPSRNFIQNCKIINPVIKYGTFTGGVGYVVSHNYYDRTMAFVSASNEAIIEYNEFNIGPDSIDAGMIYVSGSHLSARGNHIRYNYLHHIEEAHAGVYIDDCGSGQYVYGNVVDVDLSIAKDNWFGGIMGYRLHNGRECVFWNNICLNATLAGISDEAHYYPEWSTRWKPMCEDVLLDGQEIVKDPAFAARYPIYIQYYQQMLQHTEDAQREGYSRNELEEHLRSPEFCIYGNNVLVNTAVPLNISQAGLRTAGWMDTNYITEESPFDENYQIIDENVRELMSQWQDIPFDRMGIVTTP